MLNGKVMILSSFNSWIDKKDIASISAYFREPQFLVGSMKLAFNLPNYVTKADFKNELKQLELKYHLLHKMLIYLI